MQYSFLQNIEQENEVISSLDRMINILCGTFFIDAFYDLLTLGSVSKYRVFAAQTGSEYRFRKVKLNETKDSCSVTQWLNACPNNT